MKYREETRMKIIWLGHSSFRIEIADQVLLVDPWLRGNPSFDESKFDEAIAGATAILMSHGHGDHGPLQLATGDLMWIPTSQPFRVRQFQGPVQRFGALTRCFLAHLPMENSRLGHLRANRERRIEGGGGALG